jgi:hypothetical protein
MEHALLRSRNHRARQVRAFLTVGDQIALAQSHEHTRIVFGRVRERDRPAHGQLVERGDAANLGLAASPSEPVLAGNPELP